MSEELENDNIDYSAVVDQLQHENEELRVKLTQALKSPSPISETIDGIVLVVQKTDPMRLYIWACIATMIVFALARILEVFIK